MPKNEPDWESIAKELMPYRDLYASTKRSMKELSNKHAQLAAAHRRMRAGLLALLKRNFPVLYKEAEMAVNRQEEAANRVQSVGLAGINDDNLLAMVEQFLSSAKSTNKPRSIAGLAELRAALEAFGVKVPSGTNLVEWAAAVQDARKIEIPSYELDDLADLFEPKGSWAQEILDPTANTADLGDLFDESEPWPEDIGYQYEGEDPWVDSSASVPSPPAATSVAPVTGEVKALASSDMAAIPSDQEPFEVKNPWEVDDADWEKVTDAESVSHIPAVVPVAEPLRSPDTPKKTEPKPKKREDIVKAPMVPTLFADNSSKRKPKKKTKATITVEAESPQPETSVDKEETLLSLAERAQPVFVADLVDEAGSFEAANNWVDEMRRAPKTPIKVITSNQHRNKNRGSLLRPQRMLREPTPDFAASYWFQVLNSSQYRGPRLYELAVVLHRAEANKELIGTKFEGDLAVLHTHSSRGPQGVVVVMGSDLSAGSPTRIAVADAIEGLLADTLTRVSSIVVLATAPEDLEHLVSALGEARLERGWKVRVPVLLQKSWDWNSPSGQAAEIVLGPGPGA